MSSRFTAAEIRDKYEEIAPIYDRSERLLQVLGLERWRRGLLGRARGTVLDVAAGTGLNFPHYPKDCRITAVDLSPSMLAIARKRAADLGLPVAFAIMDAEALAFPDHAFDTVASTMSVCTFPDPVAALREMRRVCRPDGQVLLLEHGRSSVGWIGRWQDRRADRFAQTAGCNWNREPFELARAAGLRPLMARRHFLGVFHVMQLEPGG